jgi:hypothetical protein
MDREDIAIVKEALRTKMRDETMERAVGRAARRNSLDFARYIKIMSGLRAIAESSGASLEDAASSLSGEVDD